jgi:oxidase EvaA
MWRPEQKEMREIEKCFENKALFRSIFTPPEQNPLPHIYRHINNIKMFDDTKREIVPLKSLSGWGMENGEFVSHGHADFKVVFCDIAIEGREVLRWTQPLFEAMGIATFGLVSFKKDGKQMFVTAARHEVGTFDRVELGPTLQEEAGCVPEERDAMAKLVWEQIEQNPACIRYDVLLSEEGGRFYHEQNRNIIIELTEEQIGTLPKGYFAVDYYTVNQLIQINNTCNIQLRNLLSLLEVF